MQGSKERAGIREQAQRLGFEDWASGDLAQLEADVRASIVLKLSKELREAAECSDYANALSRAREIVAFIADGTAAS
jgi:hypothetical protein